MDGGWGGVVGWGRGSVRPVGRVGHGAAAPAPGDVIVIVVSAVVIVDAAAHGVVVVVVDA